MNLELMLKNVMTPLVALAAAWLARKIPFIDAATWSGWIDGILTAITTGVLAFFNRPSNIIDAAGKQAGTTVVTTPEIANALPANPDVIPATPQIVAAVNAAK
jgi:hypothetical protein